MKINLSAYAPPGYNYKRELRILCFGISVSFFLSLWFFIRLSGELQQLYFYIDSVKCLNQEAIMPDFIDLMGSSLLGFILLTIFMLVTILFRYGYHYQDSKSIYLMKRLPKKSELHKRCLTVPIIAAIACLLLTIAIFFIDFGIYFLATPKECLSLGQWQKIWEALLCWK